MSLDHDTGDMDGEILQGRHAGKRLSDLDLATLRELFDEFSTIDEESAALLAAYLDRAHGEEWRAGADTSHAGAADADSGTMSRREALEILGLDEPVEPQAVKAAHRRLMQKLHPDRGGSSYLAAKINRAKDVLLDAG